MHSQDDVNRELGQPIKSGVPIKLKGGQGLPKDTTMLRLASSFLTRAKPPFAVDFNGSYTPAEFIELAKQLVSHPFCWGSLLFIEQPPSKDFGVEGLGEARNALGSLGLSAPVVADESFMTSQDAIRCNQHQILLNYKLHRLGGLFAAQEIEAATAHTSLPAMLGGTFPTAIGRAYDQHAACVLRSITLPSDGWLPSTEWFRDDKHLIEDQFIRNARGCFEAPRGLGLGVTVNWDKVSRYTVPDPRAEYARIRSDQDGRLIRITLRDKQSYRRAYESITGRRVEWNL